MFFSFFLSLFLFGCASIKEMDTAKSNKVNELKELNKSLELLKGVTERKKETGKLPKEEASKIITAIDQKISENFRSIKIVEKITSADYKKGTLNEFDEKITLQERSIKNMRDLYNLETFTVFSSAKFFKAGEFTLSKDVVTQVMKDLEPLADGIIKFLNTHQNQKLRTVIGIYGYSDAQIISSESKSYKALIPQIKKPNSTSDELNQKLSELRAQSLGNVVDALMKKKLSQVNNLSLINFEINVVGRGTELPGNIPDPKIDDERRRIVTFVWSVIPVDLFKKF